MKKVQLFCIPHAGGSASVYFPWKKYIDQSIELLPVELAGRGKRFGTQLYNSFYEIVGDVFELIKPYLNGLDYALFGHSMGSWIVYELCHKLKDYNYPMPVHLFFSGRFAPHIEKNSNIHHNLPDDEFIERITKLGGIHKSLIDNQEMMNLFVPILKSDYKALSTYKYNEKNDKLNVDFTTFYGTKDVLTEGPDINEWGIHTRKKCRVIQFDEGHFFIQNRAEEIAIIINSTLVK